MNLVLEFLLELKLGRVLRQWKVRMVLGTNDVTRILAFLVLRAQVNPVIIVAGLVQCFSRLHHKLIYKVSLFVALWR